MDQTKSLKDGSITTLRSSRGAVYLNPDGTFVYLNPLKNDVTQVEKTIISEPGQLILPVFGDDELAFFINPADLPEFVDEVIDTYVTHSRVFMAFLIVQMVVEAMFDYLIYCNQERALKQVMHYRFIKLAIIYNKVPLSEIHRMFMICLMVDVAFYAIYYPIGIMGTFRKSYRMFNTFGVLSIVGVFVQIFLSYINKFNMLIFFFRIFSYIYAKFLAHLILNLILLPH